MKYLFDTDHISILQRRAGSEFTAIMARIALHAPTDLAFPIISFHEQLLGCHTFITRAKTAVEIVRGYNLLEEIRQVFTAASVLPFDAAAARVFDDLVAQKIRIGTMDMRIAAIALSQNLILLTRNVGDFSKVPNLITEDWTV